MAGAIIPLVSLIAPEIFKAFAGVEITDPDRILALETNLLINGIYFKNGRRLCVRQKHSAHPNELQVNWIKFIIDEYLKLSKSNHGHPVLAHGVKRQASGRLSFSNELTNFAYSTLRVQFYLWLYPWVQFNSSKNLLLFYARAMFSNIGVII